jgi:pSer/pThr/pTyr-binding forkhead associated (FHA) protein
MPDRLAPNSQPRPPVASLALRFISGKYQGGEFPLTEGQEIVIGRSSELDMVLVEEMVSRRHARIQVNPGRITIEDLGSTNGTFVNGERITQVELKEGDRILIGTSILKVVAVTNEAESRRNLESVAVRRVTVRSRNLGRAPEEAPRMTGNLEEIALPDLMQLFGASRKSGVLLVRTESRIGRVYLDEGQIHYAVIDGQPELAPLKAAYRMLSWSRGFFELDPPEARRFDNALDISVQEVLMEGFRQQDEFNQLKEKLPPLDQRLSLRTPLEVPLHELEPPHLDVLQLALNAPSIEVLLDRSPVSDLDTGRIIMSLLERGYLKAGK